MKQLNYILILSIAICSTLYANSADQRTAIFPKNKAKELIAATSYNPKPKYTSYWTPTYENLADTESNLNTFLKQKGVDKPKDFKNYYRQVTGVTIGSKKYLYIYYFNRSIVSNDAVWWKSKPAEVLDGGDSFFRVLYSLSEKKFVWFECNGDA